MMTSLALLLSDMASQQPDLSAVRHDHHFLTCAALRETAARVAALLAARGIGIDEQVGLMLRTSRSSPPSITGSSARTILDLVATPARLTPVIEDFLHGGAPTAHHLDQKESTT